MTEVESNQAFEASLMSDLENYKLGINNIIYQVSIAKDGDAWCALLGKDLQNGIAGFGDSVKKALVDLAGKIQD